MKIKLTQPALKDLAAIGQYTRINWGGEQAKQYRESLATRFKWLGSNKSLWIERPELAENIYTYLEQSHAIVFWEYKEGIEILRVLHKRMDLEQQR